MEKIIDCIVYGLVGLLAIGGTVLVGYVMFHGILRLIGIHRAKVERDARIELYKILSRDIDAHKIMIFDDSEPKSGRYPWEDVPDDIHSDPDEKTDDGKDTKD